MSEQFQTAALLAATVTTGWSAGLFFTYFFSVMRALRRLDDRTFVEVMQQLNRTIFNGWFALAFAGAPMFTATALALRLAEDSGGALPWIAIAMSLHGTVIAVTFGVNVPLNNALDAAGEPADLPDPAAVRERFEAKWVRWNAVRAAASAAALACLAWALAAS